MLTHGKSSRARIPNFITWGFGHSMRAIVGPLCSCLSYNKYHKENLTENLNRIKVLSLEYKCKEIGNLLSQIEDNF